MRLRTTRGRPCETTSVDHELRLKTPIILPNLGAGDQEIRLVQWLVESGDNVIEGDRVAEVLVGGILFHVSSPADGVLSRTIDTEDALLAPSATLGFVETQE